MASWARSGGDVRLSMTTAARVLSGTTLVVAVVGAGGCTAAHTGTAAGGSSPAVSPAVTHGAVVSPRVVTTSPPPPATITPRTATITPRTATIAPRTATRPRVAGDVTALAWSPSRVPASVVTAARRLTKASVVEVANGTAWLPGVAGWSTPIDVSAADPSR